MDPLTPMEKARYIALKEGEIREAKYLREKITKILDQEIDLKFDDLENLKKTNKLNLQIEEKADTKSEVKKD